MTDTRHSTTPAATVRLLPILEAKRGHDEEVRRLVTDLQAASRRDTGCLDYTVFRHEDSWSTFVLHEEWTSAEAWEAHNAQPHVAEFLTAAAPLLEGGLTIFRPSPPAPATPAQS
ncbi:putative quinol monooxygenase [Planctomonas deserti]|uniref:putative quinol monooxygenase n=1 Tax=Planctomonas deserti TaxID=2144185 RepID=UPI000D3BFA97|nr:putative quinol monooxygenase [Planctomonas deserti]